MNYKCIFFYVFFWKMNIIYKVKLICSCYFVYCLVMIFKIVCIMFIFSNEGYVSIMGRVLNKYMFGL